MAQVTAVDEPLLTTFGRLVEAHGRLNKQLGRSLEAQAGIPYTWFEVLLRIGRSEGSRLSMSALAEQVVLTSGGVTRLVDRMIEAELVQRVPCPSDRRVWFVTLTEPGEAALSRAATVHVEDLKQVFRAFSEPDLRRLDTLLDRLREVRLT
jgi:MarR family transcriptional regulator, 2-MHQ and catechol-resistance regulon repressor